MEVRITHHRTCRSAYGGSYFGFHSLYALSFQLIPTPFTPTVPNSYGTLICLAISSTGKCLIWSFYSLGQMFAAASFRFHLAMDTLALGYSLPAIRVASGLAPVRQCSCRAYQEGWCVITCDTPSY